MRRVSVGALGAVLLMVLLPLTLSSCWIACGCVSTPDPNWTPLPESATDAQAGVAKFAAGRTGVTPEGLTTTAITSGQAKALFRVEGPTVTDAVVDAYSGMVIEWFDLGRLPESAVGEVSSDQAQTTATTFIGDRGRYLDGLKVTTTLRQTGSTSAYVVTWLSYSPGAQGMSVFVNGSSGEPFAFVDEQFNVVLVPPVIGAGAAGRLAVAAVSTPGEAVASTEFKFDLENPSWTVHLAVPGSGAGASSTQAVDVTVNAATGVAKVGSSS
jgi:hypothetical protein